MKKFDCFVFDIDGTLIDKDLIMPKENIYMLKKLKELGKVIIIASGRMLCAVKKFMYENIGEVFPCICYNGSMVWIPKDGIIFEANVDGNTSAEVVEFLRRRNMHRQAYVNDVLYSEEDNEFIKSYSKHTGVDYKVVKDLKELVMKKGSTKLLTIGDEKRLNEIKKEAMHLFGDRLEIFKSFPTYLDFTLKGINKGVGLKKLCEYMKIDLKRTVAFGDNENDIPMLEIVGLPIGVGKVDGKLKKKVKMVVEDGPKNLASFVLDNILTR